MIADTSPELAGAIFELGARVYDGWEVSDGQFTGFLPDVQTYETFFSLKGLSRVAPIYFLGDSFRNTTGRYFVALFMPDFAQLPTKSDLRRFRAIGSTSPPYYTYEQTVYRITLPAREVREVFPCLRTNCNDPFLQPPIHWWCPALLDAYETPPILPYKADYALIHPKTDEAIRVCFPGHNLEPDGTLVDRRVLDACVSQVFGVQGYVLLYPLRAPEEYRSRTACVGSLPVDAPIASPTP